MSFLNLQQLTDVRYLYIYMCSSQLIKSMICLVQQLHSKCSTLYKFQELFPLKSEICNLCVYSQTVLNNFFSRGKSVFGQLFHVFSFFRFYYTNVASFYYLQFHYLSTLLSDSPSFQKTVLQKGFSCFTFNEGHFSHHHSDHIYETSIHFYLQLLLLVSTSFAFLLSHRYVCNGEWYSPPENKMKA